VSRSVHVDQLVMARQDLRWGLVGLLGVVVVALLWPAPPVLSNVALPGLIAASLAVRSFTQLRRLHRTDPALSLASEHSRAVEQSAALAAHHAKAAAVTPVVTLALAGVIAIVTFLEWSVGTPRAIEAAALAKSAVRAGEWWRLLSASFLHISMGHLVGNLFALVMIGSIVETYDGRMRVALVYLVSVLGCSLASQFLTPVTSLGASGGVLGLGGYLAVVAGRRHSEAPRFLGRRATLLLILTAMNGLIASLHIDNAGHLGGVVGGALVGLFVIAAGARPSLARAFGAASRAAAAVLIGAAVFTAFVVVAHSAPPVRGLDRVTIAVNDLDAASARFRALGFTLEAGPHRDDGLTSQQATFADGTGIDLVTILEARDDRTGTYREHLAKGDGPAFLSLFAPDRTAEVRRFEAEVPPYMLFGSRASSPADRPAPVAHANTAESLVAVWIAGADLAVEPQLLQRMGATLTTEIRYVPDRTHVTVANFGDSQVILLPATSERVPGRRIVGATVKVKSLDFILHVKLGQTLPVIVKRDAAIASAFVPPELAHGLWLEFWRDTRPRQGK